MKRIILLFSLILSLQIVYSQEGLHEGQMTSPIPENFLSASPDVMAFQKYNAIPVSLYTGKIDLSIPIFNIQSGGINIPISISYNSGGIKVDDYASSVGLGWNLNAGGSIIRNIKDLPDNEVGFRLATESDWDVGMILYDWLSSTGYNRKQKFVQTQQNSWYFNSASQFKSATYIEDPTYTQTTPMSGDFPGYGSHQEDISPDIFMANAPGLSTSFTSINSSSVDIYPNNNSGFTTTFLNNDGSKMESLILDRRNVNGQGLYTLNGDSTHSGRTQTPLKDFFEFNIINNQGLKYEFADEEVSESFYAPLATQPNSIDQWNATWLTMFSNNYNKRINSWNLTSIEDPKSNKTVSFDYDAYVNSNQQRNTFVNAKSTINSGTPPSSYSSNYCFFQLNQPRTAAYEYTDAFESLERHIKRKRLTKITFDEGEVVFVYALNRSDYTGEKALTEVQVKNQDGDIIKRVKFNYTYFTSKENCSTQECKRLRLDSVDFIAGNNIDSNGSYTFDYEYTNKLPKRGSLQQDYLGFYNNNGVTGNSSSTVTLKPKLYFYSNQGRYSILPFQKTGATAQNLLGDIDLEPNSYSLTGILKKVTFPTGGTTEFTYENNKFQFEGQEYTSGGARVITQTVKNNNTVVKQLNYEYKETDGKSSGYINNIPVYGYLEWFKRSPFTVYDFNVYDKPKGGIELSSGSFVGYSRVKEIETNNGHTEYLFSSPKNDANTAETRTTISSYPSPYTTPSNNSDCISKFKNNNAYPSMVFIDNDYKRGKIERKSTYDQLNNLLLKEETTYTNRTLSSQNIQKTVKLQATKEFTATDIYDTALQYLFDVASSIPKAQDLTTHKKTTEYLDGNIKIIDEYYTYDTNYPYIKEQRIVDGDGELKTNIYYPFDSQVGGQPNISTLVAQNRLFTPVKEELRKGSVLTLTNLTNFKNFGNSLILPKSLSKAKGNETLYEDAIIDLRDDKGNILQYHNQANVYYSIIWGYDKQHPVAKIENATYASIEVLSGFGTNFTITNSLSTSQENTLRGLSNAMVTTYTHKPMVGILTITDPKEYKTTYVYDEFNRLQFVKDADGKIINYNEYHIKD